MRNVLDIDAAEELLRRRRARRELLEFLQYTWWEPGTLHIGQHTKSMAQRITRAVDDYMVGRSTFLVILVPFRHGKSDMVSRALTPFFLGRCHEAGLHPDVIMTGYGATLVESFSRRCKANMRSHRYRNLFPTVSLAQREKDTMHNWKVSDSSGEVIATGLGGAIVGRGGDLIIIDDYCKKREEAESEAYRRQTWNAFKDDVMSRRAPTSIVIVCATPWHVDDLVGRIRAQMDKDADFPRFEFVSYPARHDAYPGGYLFLERFSKDWYEQQYATLGAYSSAGLLDCEPRAMSGHLLNTDGVQIETELSEFPAGRYIRFWDLASSEKQRVKDDPDRTVGALGIVVTKNGLPEFWVKDVQHCQRHAPERDALIVRTARDDGPSVVQCVESQGGYKDTYFQLQNILRGQSRVEKITVSTDKVVRASEMEGCFQGGRVHFYRGPWNQMCLDELGLFPLGAHDDFTDALSGCYLRSRKKPIGVVITR